MQAALTTPHGSSHLEQLHDHFAAQIQDPRVTCAAEKMAAGLQYLSISAALGRSPRQLNIAPPNLTQEEKS